MQGHSIRTLQTAGRRLFRKGAVRFHTGSSGASGGSLPGGASFNVAIPPTSHSPEDPKLTN